MPVTEWLVTPLTPSWGEAGYMVAQPLVLAHTHESAARSVVQVMVATVHVESKLAAGELMTGCVHAAHAEEPSRTRARMRSLMLFVCRNKPAVVDVVDGAGGEVLNALREAGDRPAGWNIGAISSADRVAVDLEGEAAAACRLDHLELVRAGVEGDGRVDGVLGGAVLTHADVVRRVGQAGISSGC